MRKPKQGMAEVMHTTYVTCVNQIRLAAKEHVAKLLKMLLMNLASTRLAAGS